MHYCISLQELACSHFDQSGTSQPPEAVDWLVHSCLCDGLPLDEIRQLAGLSRAITLEPGEILFDDADRLDAVHIVARGEMAFLVRANPAGEFTEVARVEAGQFFGEGGALEASHLGSNETPQPRSARIVARAASQLLRLDQGAFLKLLERHPRRLTANLLRQTAEKHQLGSRLILNECLERESGRIFEEMARWMTQSIEDSATTLLLNADYLGSANAPAHLAEAITDLAGAASDLARSLAILGQIGGAGQGSPQFEAIPLRAWWQLRADALTRRLAARGVTLDAYVEECSLVTSPELLASSLDASLDSLAELAGGGQTLELRVGRSLGEIEFRFTLRVAGLSEFAVSRLFQPFTPNSSRATIGLSFVRHNARLLGGDATVKRRVGDQITIVFHLPVQPIHET